MAFVQSGRESVLLDTASVLREELSSGHYPRGSKFPSEYELANRFGINKTTANRVVAQLVQDGYLERGTKGMGTRVIRETLFPVGQIAFFGHVRHHHVSLVYNGAARRLWEAGYVLAELPPSPARLQEYLDNLNEKLFHGVLTMSYGGIFTPRPIPVIHVDQSFPATDKLHHSVSTDNFQGAYSLMNALYAAGHREIAVFLTDIGGTHLSQPQQGFIRSMQEHGCPEVRKRFFYGRDGQPDSIREVLPRIMKAFPEVTAIVTENDNDALATIIEGTKTVPDFMNRVQVTGFGGLEHVYSILPIPGIDQRFEKMGEVAAEEILKMIRNGIPEQPLRRVLETRPLNFDKIRRR